ncbi:hypothetical protein F5Y16DRAFT_135050 [Xylariaceae sp. FL0255]|nr:hypothetical protein F5Y16DRAFT_135050 [Xylariaceae sp. FL0255]
MSAREPHGQSISPRTWISSPTGTNGSPQTSLRGGSNHPTEGSSLPTANGDAPRQISLPRSLGVHNILNPADAQHAGRSDVSTVSPHLSSTASTPSSHAQSPHMVTITGQSLPVFGQTTPAGRHPSSSAPSPAERNSPSTSHPLPAMASTRHIHDSRAVSVDQNVVLRPRSGPHDAAQPFPEHSGLRGSSLLRNSNRLGHPLDRASSHIAPLGTPPPGPSQRATSQPILGNPDVGTQVAPYVPPRNQGPQHQAPPGWPPNTPFTHVTTPSTFPPVAPAPGPDLRLAGAQATPFSFGSGGTRNMTFADGQQAILHIQPTFGPDMMIPVDTHQGSKQSNDKRKRNAVASAKFRENKKKKDEEGREEIRRLRWENRQFSTQLGMIQADAERLRGDRDRLRNIVAATEGISHHAYTGPPTPPRPVVSLGGYVSDMSDSDTGTVDLPSKRRRTEPGPRIQFSPAPFASLPSSFPSPQHPPPLPGYSTSISQPGTPSSSRLPPLRLEQAGPPPTSAPPNLHMSPAGQAFPPVTREPQNYETRWATGLQHGAGGGRPRPPDQR